MPFSEETTITHGTRTLTIKVQCEPGGVTASIGEGPDITEVSFSYPTASPPPGNPLSSQVTFSILQEVLKYGPCIAQCLAIHVGKAVLECVIKNRRSVSEIEKCLKGKLLGSAIEAAACVFEKCFNGA